MGKVNSTNELLGPLMQQVEQQLQTAIRVFQNLPEHELLRQPKAGGWGIAQCLWHLNSYGDFYLPHLQKAVNEKRRELSFFKSGWFGAYFIKIMKPQTSSRKYRAFKDHVPPDQPDAYVEVARFIQQQELLLSYLRQAYSADLNKRLPISISKWITLKTGDVFQFLIAHAERHIQQALRNLPDYSPEK